ncbi:uncharacterized protein SAPINGB_P003047 [Magnusiomyces paraingens]|uniref:Uncharacterized protein n=1 Tax=Magnusiomyces paraingens TaxID=2606893 RepID=A0A5E8BK75_9ASCO|nr:uncharacterized protein SAPINGB_P003047 [Saprochaete ingens]VVT51289.1 unnamed protein product [Saprochaete ingens]
MTKGTLTTSSIVQAPVLSIASTPTTTAVSAPLSVPVSSHTGADHSYITIKPSSLPSTTISSGFATQTHRQRHHPIAIAPKPVSKTITRRASLPTQSMRPRKCSKNLSSMTIAVPGGMNDKTQSKPQPITLASPVTRKGSTRSVSASAEDTILAPLEPDSGSISTKRSGSPTPGVQPAKRKECNTKQKCTKQRHQNVSGTTVNTISSKSSQIATVAQSALKNHSNQEDTFSSSLLSIDENPLLSSLDSNLSLDVSSVINEYKELPFNQISGKTRPGVRALHEVQSIERTHFFSPPSSPAPNFSTSIQLAPEAPSSIFSLDSMESSDSLSKDSDHYISPQVSAQSDLFLFDKQPHISKPEPISFLPESFCNEPIFGLSENNPLLLPVTSTGTPPTQENSPAMEESALVSVTKNQVSDPKLGAKEKSKKNVNLKTEKEVSPASFSSDLSLTHSSESALALSPDSSSSSSSLTSPDNTKTQSFNIENNPDYIALTSALSILESQRAKARRDIICLKNLKTEALRNPEDFMREVRKTGRVYGAPTMQNIVRAPFIQWEKYGIDLSDLEQRIRRGIVDNPEHASFSSIRLFDEFLGPKRNEF